MHKGDVTSTVPLPMTTVSLLLARCLAGVREEATRFSLKIK